MPLPDPANRKLIHKRCINLNGYQRDDGQWDIEAHLTDQKTYDFFNKYLEKNIAAEEYVHQMWLRLTVTDDFIISDVETATDDAPFPICPQATQNFKVLIGEKIAAGWNKRVRELLGGTKGCTHRH